MFPQVRALKSPHKLGDSEGMALNNPKCPACGGKMKRNGRTSSGAQRWRCRRCGASSTHGNDTDSRALKRFLAWLLTKERQVDMQGGGRTFRRNAERFWRLWPLPRDIDEIHRVIYVDGIHLGRTAVVLIAASDEYVLGWHLAKSENADAWGRLIARVAPPQMVVTDGGSGLAKAVRRFWPSTRIQRCVFHAYTQVRTYTTSRPRLQAGAELLSLAEELLRIETLHQAEWWVERFMQWSAFWADFLEEKTRIDGRMQYTHERLRKARASLATLINKGVLFTYLDPVLSASGPLPATNNRIEGGINSPLRDMLRNHRGLSVTRRIKAVFWWCYLHQECPPSPAEMLRTMPTDDDIDLLQSLFATKPDPLGRPERWGSGLVWEELHMGTPYRE